MLIKVVWPDGIERRYETNQEGINRMKNHFNAMYCMGELELVETIWPEVGDE